jgi:hypothetical protein
MHAGCFFGKKEKKIEKKPFISEETALIALSRDEA